jgi:ribonuclease P protein component
MPKIARLVHRSGFERLLAVPPRWRSTHFVMHHVSDCLSSAMPINPRAVTARLSTDKEQLIASSVDKPAFTMTLGILVPKRHERRAVTRNLIRRQVRAVFMRHAASLPAGSWLVRLRAPFARAEFVSAASRALARALRDELEPLVARAGRNGAPRSQVVAEAVHDA